MFLEAQTSLTSLCNCYTAWCATRIRTRQHRVKFRVAAGCVNVFNYSFSLQLSGFKTNCQLTSSFPRPSRHSSLD